MKLCTIKFSAKVHVCIVYLFVNEQLDVDVAIFLLLQELATGEPVLVDLNEESDNEDQDFDSWEPDPVDADPCMYWH